MVEVNVSEPSARKPAEIQRPPPSGGVKAAAVLGSLVAVAAAWFCLFSVVLWPRRSIYPPAVIGICAAVGLWLWWAFRQSWFRDTVLRWIASVLMGCCLATFLISTMWEPPWLWIAIWLGVMLTALIVLVAAVVRFSRHSADALIAVGIAIVLTLSTTYWYSEIQRFGEDTRLWLVADDYQAQVKDFENDERDLTPDADRVVGNDDAGNPIAVAWIWSRGLAVGHSFGVAYMPNIEFEPDYFGTISPLHPRPDFGYRYPRFCRHAFDDFYFCSFH